MLQNETHQYLFWQLSWQSIDYGVIIEDLELEHYKEAWSIHLLAAVFLILCIVFCMHFYLSKWLFYLGNTCTFVMKGMNFVREIQASGTVVDLYCSAKWRIHGHIYLVTVVDLYCLLSHGFFRFNQCLIRQLTGSAVVNFITSWKLLYNLAFTC